MGTRIHLCTCTSNMAMVKFMCIAPKDNLDPPDEISRENSDIEVRVSYHANHPRHPHPPPPGGLPQDERQVSKYIQI